VRGRANAGGVGLAAACDLVLADRTATFALSELLFGLFPACVLPFLARRVGLQKAHFLTLSTRPIHAEEALAWGLADALGDDAEVLLRAHLRRLAHLEKSAIGRYKAYMAGLSDLVSQARHRALDANRTMFADPGVQRDIMRYVREMKFPWEP
jgi:polyketide biosynthesis enoyl-CoA hydratase PksH